MRSAWAYGPVGLCVLAASTVWSGESAPAAKPARGAVLSEKPRYSHAKEELVIRDFFQDKRDGIFLDVGCWHPIQDSNTYYLEHHLGWSGIGVDALPEMARKWKRNRPASKFFNYIVTDHSDTTESFFRSAEYTDISAIDKPAKGPGGHPVNAEEVKVPTITLTKLLEANGVTKVDFVSMDIEGAEPLALAGFDIERFKPELLCVEAKVKNREFLAKYFADHGYAQIERYLDYDKTNYYYAPKGKAR
jgi:FkbM family methyltransferase